MVKEHYPSLPLPNARDMGHPGTRACVEKHGHQDAACKTTAKHLVGNSSIHCIGPYECRCERNTKHTHWVLDNIEPKCLMRMRASPSAAGPLDSLVAKWFGGLVAEWLGDEVGEEGGGGEGGGGGGGRRAVRPLTIRHFG